MCKRLIWLIFVVVVLALAGDAGAQLDPAAVTDGHVYLFDDVGGNLPDDSANSNAGNLIGSPQIVAGLKGNALQFNGTSDGVHLPDSAMIGNTGTHQNRTVIAMFNCADVSKSDKQVVFEEGGYTRGLTIYVHDGLAYGAGWNKGGDYSPEWSPGAFISAPIGSNEWHVVAIVLRDGGAGQEDDKFEMWMDGVLIGKGPGGELRGHSNDNGIGYAKENVVFHDGNGNADGHYFEGMVDEIWILNVALTAGELGGFAGKVWPFAAGPIPADGEVFEATWANLAWKPGGLAVSSDVYFGTSFDDVNNGAEGTFAGNTASDFQIVGFPGFPVAEGLAPGTTYYWRVDAINDANSDSPWKGDVWSFTVPSLTAYNADPPDGMRFVDSDLTLTWMGGFGAKFHNVYFGDNFDEVSSAVGALPLADASYSPGTLELGKTYYWRIDEFDGAASNKGDVWSFRVKPDIPIADPDLLCWWTLDEGLGTAVLDWSGHGHDGTFSGEPQWVDGYDGSALKFDGSDDYVIHQLPVAQNFANFTVALWARADSLGQGEYMSPFSSHTPNSSGIQIDVDGTYPGNYRTNPPGGTTSARFGPAILGWVHLALVGQGTTVQYYYNGTLSTTETFATDNLLFNEFIIGTSRNNVNHLNGAVDDLRVYTRALSQEEIQLVMRIDPLRAWNSSPTNGSTPDIDTATPLTWSPGDSASSHEVYFGLDKDAVDSADSSDATGIYRGSQNGTSFTPAEGVEWGGGPYYWRIDENNANGTVTKGRVWSFTVADFILVDDFESFTDDDVANEAIWQHWIDGFGVPTNGAQASYLVPPYAEQAIINGGGQSMPLFYDNRAGVSNSEVELALTAGRDWTKNGVGVLSLWFRGYPPSVGGFTEGPVGTYTMTGSGADIWGTADQFHYAYRTLTGPGTIVARVDSLQNTHNWAKAGVMIRETLNSDSRYAFALVSAVSGVAFQGRTDTGASAFGTTEAGIAAPHWVKLERDVAGNFTVSHSTNGSSWVPVQNSVPTNIQMASTVYIGLAVTSHDAALTCEAKFSNVTMTGTAGPQWASQDIGILGNNAEPLYVSLSNAGGTPAVVVNSDANASVTDVWTEWLIDLQLFADQGVNLTNVDKIAIGLGATGDANATGGSGMMFIDDVRLLRPAP